MHKKITFTGAERDVVQALLVGPPEFIEKPGQRKALTSLLRKMDAAMVKAVDEGLSAYRYVEIAKEELGGRLALPPNPGPAFWAKLKNRLRELGLTEESARRVVKVAGRTFTRGPIEADFILWKATHLLAAAGPAKARPVGDGERKGPLPLGE